ncbi:mannitol dehydrogenase family protein [Falsirhodobacter halotolerans]|uniref:mannitol dehydrogenase family protein n=1 Tax=Falsirhodobacter halotolerans TaxID=1146892 RepID=UPI001FD488C1|nr:mannitol dehydrogenase family protein [Falsirhodobacter halotolerans]MCJ8139715.1 mannitol dehydrogenase family protein [Falsirhodobacter halotolerans]
MKLNNATLASLPVGVTAPAYDRATLTPGIVHIGCGNFHRAHMAVYLDDLFAMGGDRDWSILGAGVRAADDKMRTLLEGQDYLSTVTELDPTRTSTRVIGAMTGFVPVDPTNAPLIAAMSDPAIRIVSLTVTEGGYFIDPKTGTFSPDHPSIQHDAAHPDTPETAFGAIIAALKARRAAGVPAFTVMCCDNVPHNGHVTRDAVTGLCRLFDADLADWIAANVAFPNAMVDRITPATGPRELQMVRDKGVEDDAPVTCESFRQWVVEDNFPTGRPALEKVGVTFTDAVDAYETMKIRILNGGHAIIAYPGGLKGIHFVHEAMEDAQIRAFLDKVETDEILHIVPPVPDTDLVAYKSLILDRCSNPAVADTVRRLCLDGSNRQPKFIVPSIRDLRAKGSDATGLILLSALWCRYCFGEDERGDVIEPNDPNWAHLTWVSGKARENPAEWLAMREVYGDLGDDPVVAARFDELLRAVWAEGSAAVIARYLDGTL